MKKFGSLFLSVLILFIILIGFGKKIDTEKKELYSKKAAETIQLLNSGKTDELQNQFDAKMKLEMTKESLDSVVDYVKEAGDFEKIEKTSVEEKDGNYITVSIAKYTNKKIIFTITYNSSDEIAGIYLK